MQVWDTAGQERFRSLVSMYYRNADAALLVYDVTNPVSFESLERWRTELIKHVGAEVVLLVVGNKVDLSQARVVDESVARAYAESIGAEYIEASATDNKSINNIFRCMGKLIVKSEQRKTERAKERLLQEQRYEKLMSITLSNDGYGCMDLDKRKSCKC